MSRKDSSSLVVGDESRLVAPGCPRPEADVVIDSSWCESSGVGTSSLWKKFSFAANSLSGGWTHSYKLGSDLGRLVRLRFGEHSLYDSLRAFGCAVFCFPLFPSVGVWSPPPSAWFPWGDPPIIPDDPPIELVVLLDPWWKSVCEESGCPCSCEVLLDVCVGRWNWTSPLGRAENDAERSKRDKKNEVLKDFQDLKLFFQRIGEFTAYENWWSWNCKTFFI